MSKIQLVIVGGFLGSGKTTSILNIANYLIGQGKKVGVVTNDQSTDLVDTHFLKLQGLTAVEVTDGCFCCNFDEFLDKINKLSELNMPDVILAEPVGSCTDLIATIYKPLKAKNIKSMEIKPFSVIADPKRLKKLILEKSSNFHSEINYLFKKQLEEADIIVLNKIDLLSEGEKGDLIQFVKQNFKNAEVLAISARENKNVDKWIEMIFSKESAENTLDINYEIYGQAEAYLGWLNLTATVDTETEIDINDLISEISDKLRKEFIKLDKEIAHYKILAVSGVDWAKASIFDIAEQLIFDKRAQEGSSNWDIVLNIRADIDDQVLLEIVKEVLRESIEQRRGTLSVSNVQCFKPKQPNPTYRMR
ncbi:MAG: GTP-binding protein [Tepidanaerobacteraceae bacterium]